MSAPAPLLILALLACRPEPADSAPPLPERELACTDGVDDDADGYWDCLDADCCADPACSCGEDCGNGVDDDLDGFADAIDPDCGALERASVRALGSGAIERVEGEWLWSGVYELIATDASNATLCHVAFDWVAFDPIDLCPDCVWAFDTVRTGAEVVAGDRCDVFEFSSGVLDRQFMAIGFGEYSTIGVYPDEEMVYQPWWTLEQGIWQLYAENDAAYLNEDGDSSGGTAYGATFSRPYYDLYLPL